MGWPITYKQCRVYKLKDEFYTVIEKELSEDHSTFLKRASITIKGDKVY